MDADTNQFKEYVKEWLELDDQINTLLTAIKERKAKKIILSNLICNFMQQNEIDHMNLQNNAGKLKYSQLNIAPPLKKTVLLESLTDYLKDAELAKNAVEHIYKNREKIAKISLKRQTK